MMKQSTREQLALSADLELDVDIAHIKDIYHRRWEAWFDKLSDEQKKQWTEALWRVADSGGDDDMELVELERLWGAPQMPEDLDLIEAVEGYFNGFGES